MSATRRNEILAATRDALKKWASLSHGECPGWPTQSIMASALTGRGTGASGDMDAEAKSVEAAVNEMYRTEPDARRMILLHYLANGEIKEKMNHLGVGSKAYYFRLEQAEYAVKVRIGY